MHSFLVLMFSIIAPAIFAPPFSFLLEINVLGCAFCSLPSHAPFSLASFPGAAKLQGTEHAARMGPGRKAPARIPPAQPARVSPMPGAVIVYAPPPGGRLKEQGSDHDASLHFLPPPSARFLPPSLPPLFLSPLPASAGLRASGGCWCPALGSGYCPSYTRNWYR